MDTNLNNIEILSRMIKESHNIVFFGGAGVSTESGIPDFRSVDGLYHQKYKFPPERILSHSYFCDHTSEFYEFYKDKMLYLDARPNSTHKYLKELEDCGKLKAIITQNIDGLHQLAGNEKVLELHGSVHRNYCMNCKKFYGVKDIIKANGIPYCQCGGVIKPDVVLYEEGLDDSTVKTSVEAIRNADLLVVAGTSLAVYPAAGLIEYYQGNKLVVINMTKTEKDYLAD